MGTKAEDANLILRLYELRREEVMRKARDWFVWFMPESIEDIQKAAMGENSAYFRMVTSYWDMAASFVNHGAIDAQMFSDANAEHMVIFSKLEPFLEKIRATSGNPQYMAQLEKLVMSSRPDAKEYMETLRMRFRQFAALRAEAAKAQAG